MKNLIIICLVLIQMNSNAQKKNLNQMYSDIRNSEICISEKRNETIVLKIDSIEIVMNKIEESKYYKIFHYQKLHGVYKDSTSFFDRNAYFFIVSKKFNKGILITGYGVCHYSNYLNTRSYCFTSSISSDYLVSNQYFIYDLQNSESIRLQMDWFKEVPRDFKPFSEIGLIPKNGIEIGFVIEKDFNSLEIDDLFEMIDEKLIFK